MSGKHRTDVPISPPSAPSAREILRVRARALAVPVRPAPVAGETWAVLEFRLASERYAVEQVHVREVYPLRDLTPLPGTPAFMLGIVNVRGQILPVIDIKRFFDLPDEGITDLHVVIVVQANDMEVGILADSVAGLRLIPRQTVEASLPTLTGIRQQYLKGVTGEHVVILDVPGMLADPRILINDEVDI